MDKNIERILNLLPQPVKNFYIENIHRNITEIRVRSGFDIKVTADGKHITIQNTVTDKKFLENLYYSFCNNTVSAYEDQTANGFITLPGGNRIGLAGKFTTDLQGKTVLSEIISMNIRLSGFHTVEVNRNILDFHKGLLIAGKPHTGKTNFVKNICVALCDYIVVVCDERNELYSRFLNCDFIIGQPKHIGVMQALRTMNPDYIVCDEIGSDKETTALLNRLNSGTKFICTVHADGINALKNKPNINVLLNYQVFDKIVFLDNYGNDFFIKDVYDL